LKKNSENSCKIFEKSLSGSVETKQNQTERYSQKPEPNHSQKFFEIRNQILPKPKRTGTNRNFNIYHKLNICILEPFN
jgi:hypothetical protein